MRFLEGTIFMGFSEIRFLMNVDKGRKGEGEPDLKVKKVQQGRSNSFWEGGGSSSSAATSVGRHLCSGVF